MSRQRWSLRDVFFGCALRRTLRRTLWACRTFRVALV